MSEPNHTGTEPVNARIFPLPRVVTLLFIAAGWALNRFAPLIPRTGPVPLESLIGGVLVMACAVAIALIARRDMLRARTTYMPGEAASVLVYEGIYKRTRNPMYLSMAFFTLGLAIATANPWLAVAAPALMIYLQERVVKREEAYLSARFGGEYEGYRRKVRRWF